MAVLDTQQAQDQGVAHEKARALGARMAGAVLPSGEGYVAFEDAVLDLANSLPDGPAGAEAQPLFTFMVELRRAIEADASGTDADGRIELAVLKLRDVVRRIERRTEHDTLDDPAQALASVLDVLAPVGVERIAALLGVTSKTVSNWRRGGAVTRNADRVVLVAQTLMHLRSGMTATGLLLWFDAERPQLGGRTPRAVLDSGDPRAYELLMALARGARGQLAD